MNFRFALCLMALCGLLSFPAQAQSVATLMRVTIDGQPASREVLESSFNFETLLLTHLSRHGYEHVDLTPLKSGFQQLRYSHECPVVGGDFSFRNCESFGNYAEAVLQILNNIKLGVENQYLPEFTANDRIIISDTQIANLGRNIRVDMYLRVYDAASHKLVTNDTLHREQRMGSRGTREGMTVKLVDRVVAQAVDTLANGSPGK